MKRTHEMIPLSDGAMLARRGYHELRELMFRGKVHGERGERGRLFVSRADCERLAAEREARSAV